MCVDQIPFSPFRKPVITRPPEKTGRAPGAQTFAFSLSQPAEVQLVVRSGGGRVVAPDRDSAHGAEHVRRTDALLAADAR